VWVPDCYKWTQAGYVFVHGYWDAPLAERGLLFAPCRIARAAYVRPGFVFRPAYVVQPDFLVGSLFVREGTRRYYFGDYFDARLRRRYVPWFEHRVDRHGQDVNYAYYRQAYAAQGGSWEKGVRGLYEARYAGEMRRPPATLVQQTKVVTQLRTERKTDVMVSKTVNVTHAQAMTALAPVSQAKTVRVTGLSRLANVEEAKSPVRKTVKIEKTKETVVKEERRQVERYRAIAEHRKVAETKAAAKRPAEKKLEAPVRVKIELPKNVPPPRVVKTVTPPAPVVKHVREDRHKDKGPAKVDRPPVKDKAPPPPPPKDKAPIKDKDVTHPKDKDKFPPPPKDKAPVKDKDRPPPPPPPAKDKDKAKPPPPPPPPPKDKAPAKDKDGVGPKDKDRHPKDKGPKDKEK